MDLVSTHLLSFFLKKKNKSRRRRRREGGGTDLSAQSPANGQSLFEERFSCAVYVNLGRTSIPSCHLWFLDEIETLLLLFFFFYLPDLNKSTKKQTFFAAVGLDPGSRSWWVFLYLLILRKQRRRSSSSSWRESFTLKVRETQVRRRRILFMHIHILCIWIIMWCCCCLAHEYIQMSSGGSTRQLIENVFFSLSLLSLRTPFFLFLSKTNTRLTRHVCNGDMGSSPPYFGPPACKAGAVSPSSWPLMYTRARRCLISLVCVCVCVCVCLTFMSKKKNENTPWWPVNDPRKPFYFHPLFFFSLKSIS